LWAFAAPACRSPTGSRPLTQTPAQHIIYWILVAHHRRRTADNASFLFRAGNSQAGLSRFSTNQGHPRSPQLQLSTCDTDGVWVARWRIGGAFMGFEAAITCAELEFW